MYDPKQILKIVDNIYNLCLRLKIDTVASTTAHGAIISLGCFMRAAKTTQPIDVFLFDRKNYLEDKRLGTEKLYHKVMIIDDFLADGKDLMNSVDGIMDLNGEGLFNKFQIVACISFAWTSMAKSVIFNEHPNTRLFCANPEGIKELR